MILNEPSGLSTVSCSWNTLVITDLVILLSLEGIVSINIPPSTFLENVLILLVSVLLTILKFSLSLKNKDNISFCKSKLFKPNNLSYDVELRLFNIGKYSFLKSDIRLV